MKDEEGQVSSFREHCPFGSII